MTAAATWQPAERLVREKLCDGPRCATTFIPTSRGQRFCSDRCERAATGTVLRVAEPPCENPTCHLPAQPGFKSCSIECAEMVAQRRARAAASIGPAEIAAELDEPPPDDDDGDGQDLAEPAAVTGPGRVCRYGPCEQPPLRPRAGHGWQVAYCSWEHVQAAKAERAGEQPPPSPPPAVDPPSAGGEPAGEPPPRRGAVDAAGGGPGVVPPLPDRPRRVPGEAAAMTDEQHAGGATPAPPPAPDRDAERRDDARYDGYVAGAQAAMELCWRLLRSDTFRELDQATATAIVVEVLA